MHVPIQFSDSREETKTAPNSTYFTASSSANLLSMRTKTGLNWKQKQLDYLSHERDAVKGLSRDTTSAEKLIARISRRG
jgi:hypothetical protein